MSESWTQRKRYFSSFERDVSNPEAKQGGIAFQVSLNEQKITKCVIPDRQRRVWESVEGRGEKDQSCICYEVDEQGEDHQ